MRALTFRNVALKDGVFQLTLGLTSAEMRVLFDGSSETWVEVAAGGKTYPRQRLTAVPYALTALSVGPETAPGPNQFLTKDGSGNLVWGTPSTNATQLGGAALATGTPSPGAVLTYVGGQWQAVTDTGVLTQPGTTAPGPSPVGEGRIYFDATSNQFMVSQNGGAYAPLGTVTGGVITQVSAGAGLAGGGTTGNVTLGLAAVGAAGTYTKVQTDAYGRVMAGTSLTVADLPAVPVAKVTGTLAAAQVAAIPVGQLAGTLAAAQLPSVPVTQLAGTLTAAQLPSLSSAQITSGTLSVALGGTGVTSFPSGGVLVGAGSLPLSTVAAAGQYQVLQQGASGPVFGGVDLGQSAAVTGTLPVANGGTGSNAALTGNRLVMSSGSALVEAPAISVLGASLGIGTTSPVTDLHISGTNAARLRLEVTTGQDGVEFAYQGNRKFSLYRNGGATSNLSVWSDTYGSDVLQIGANGGVTIPVGNLNVTGAVNAGAFNSQALGIGTTTPGASLSFGGTAAHAIQEDRNTNAGTVGQSLTIAAGGAASGGTNLAGGSLVLSSGLTTGTGSSSIQFQTASSTLAGSADNTPVTRMVIDGQGRVGIGTQTPSVPLDVWSDGSANALRIVNPNNPSNVLSLYENGGAANVSTNVGDLYLSAGYRLYLQPLGGAWGGPITIQPSSSMTYSGSPTFLTAMATYAPTAGAGTYTGFKFFTTINESGTAAHDYTGMLVNVQESSAPGTNKILLDVQRNTTSRLNVWSNGNVGIGTTSPSTLLVVNGSNVTDHLVKISNTSSYGLRLHRSSTLNGSQLGTQLTYSFLDASSNEVNRAEIQGVGHNLTYDQAGELRLRTTDATGTMADRMIVRELGVGIGTGSPSSPLTVVGVIESTSGGFKFPDGSVQTVAAAGGIAMGSFTAPTSTGNYSVTGVGFKPRYVRFITNLQRTGAPAGLSSSWCTGAMTATAQYAAEVYSNTTAVRSLTYTDRAIYCSAADATDPQTKATFVSMDANGFTVNFTNVTAGWTVVWEAWQ